MSKATPRNERVGKLKNNPMDGMNSDTRSKTNPTNTEAELRDEFNYFFCDYSPDNNSATTTMVPCKWCGCSKGDVQHILWKKIKAHTAKAVEEARIEELKRLRRRFNGTNYVQLRKTINYRISQLESQEKTSE